MSNRRKSAVNSHGRAPRPQPVCPRCGGHKFYRSRGIRGLWRNLVFLFLCLFLLLPGLVYFATRQELFINCRRCGAEWVPESDGAVG